MITWTNPSYLWLLTAAIVPIAIHYINRSQRKPVGVPSLMWLIQKRKEQRRIQKIKDLWVLILRVLTVLMLVVALAGPKWLGISGHALVIDNHPALWSQQDQWLPGALEELENDVNLKIYSRDGLVGTFTTDECRQMGNWLKSSLNELPELIDATLITPGYKKENVSYRKVILPDRPKFQNVFWSQRGALLEVAGDSVFQLYRVTDSTGTLYESQRLPIDLGQSLKRVPLTFELFGDDISADNQITFTEIPEHRVSLVERSAGDADAWKLGFDTKMEFAQLTDSSIASRPNDIFVLMGFDFLPEAFEKFSNVVLRFPSSEQCEEYTDGVLPKLKHPFFQRYFIGPSLKEKWPSPNKISGQRVPFKEVVFGNSNEALAGLVSEVNRWEYAQRFTVQDGSHPYYKALLQWAESQSLNNREVLQLGLDELDQWVEDDIGGELVRSEWGKSVTPQKKIHWQWTLDKIALLAALVSALLALIFAKI